MTDPIDLSLLRGADVAIGFFDGVHLGHRKLLSALGKDRTLLTFSLDLLCTKGGLLLYTQSEKDLLLSRLGIREVVLDFERVRSMSKESFLDLLRGSGMRKVVVGEDFTFGFRRAGTAADLRSLKGLEVEVEPLLRIEGQKVSSSEIRNLLLRGRIEKANALLGEPFFLLGDVIHGKGNGHQLGFPTANLEIPAEKVHLPDGVYLTRTTIDRADYISMTNVGTHPTIDENETTLVETYVDGFDGTLYGRRISVSFLAFLRPQKRFASVADLRHQLEEDLRTIRSLARMPSPL